MDVPVLEVEQDYEAYDLRRVLVWNGKKYVNRDFVRGRPGRLVRLRAVLKPAHRAGTETVDFRLRVPANARRSGRIDVIGGAWATPEIPCFFGGFFGEFEDEGGDCGEPDGGLTFDQLLAAFEKQPRGDALVGRLRLGRSGAVRAEKTARLDAVVGGRVVLGFLLVR